MIFSFIILTASLTTPMFNKVELPTTWTPQYTITLSFSGSMSGSSVDIEFMHDRCVYKATSQKGVTEYTFKMTEAWRKEILAKLRALDVETIKSEAGTFVVNDGWSRFICFGTACIEGGTSAKMEDDHKNRFLDAFNYLQQFAINKKP